MKTLIKEVPFGKGTAVIEVTMFREKVELDGVYTGREEVVSTSKVKVMMDGNIVDEAYFAKVSGYESNPKWFEKMGLTQEQKVSRVGEKAITLGEEAAVAINASIEEMKAELEDEFGVEDESKKEEIEKASAVIEVAEKEGVNNLLSASALNAWIKNYNQIHNEGCEGYIPVRISRERYETALKTLEKYRIGRE